MPKIKFLSVLSAISAAALLSGCGSGSFDDAVEAPPFDPTSTIIEAYQESAHAASVRGPGSALCSRCHSDDGFRQHFEATAGFDADELTAHFVGVAPPAAPGPIQCTTCHGSESIDLRAPATTDEEGRIVFSQEFNLCTACHQVFLDPTFDQDSGTFSYRIADIQNYMTGGPGLHPVPALIDDHFPAQDDQGGFNINAAARNACTQCHDPHLASKFDEDAQQIAQDWGLSGHADYQGAAFTANITQSACVKCHSGVEYARFVGGTPEADLNPRGGAQAVACIACHDLSARDATGVVALGPLRPVDSVTFPSGAVVSLDGPNNLCMECHQGRSSTPTVDERIAAGNLSFSNIHFFPAAATLFGSEVQGGYEYPGRTYRGRNTFPVHEILGVPELTTCTGCHVGSPADHTFAVNRDLCIDCHGDRSFSDMRNTPRVNFDRIEDLKDQLLGVLEDSGVTRVLDDGRHVFPYFENITTPNQLKAAYNWQVADKDPGGYIHNGFYIRQLLFDSIVDMGATPVFLGP